VFEARHIRSVNDAGVHKMLRNITALRQCLKAIDVIDPADAELEAARTYYSLFPLGPSVNMLFECVIRRRCYSPAAWCSSGTVGRRQIAAAVLL